MKKKPKTKRQKNNYPALFPNLNLKSRYENIDYDYINKLSDKEKDWLNRFTEEYTNANFNHEGKRIHKPKIVEKIVKSTKKIKEIDLAKTESYDRNNTRNSDILTRQKASSQIVYLEEIDKNNSNKTTEEDIINKIDAEKLFNYPSKLKK